MRFFWDTVYFGQISDDDNDDNDDEGSSAGLLVESQQHMTGLHVPDRTARCPNTIGVFVDVAWAAVPKPPTVSISSGTVTTVPGVIIHVWGTEHSAVGVEVRILCRRHCISGVPAVSGHRQLVLTNLITDSSRKMTYLGHICRLSLFCT